MEEFSLPSDVSYEARLGTGGGFQVHVRSVVLWERARLRVYDLWVTCTEMENYGTY